MEHREYLFAEARARGLSNLASAKAAGYASAHKMANLLANRPHVQAEIKRLQDENSTLMKLTRLDVITGLQDAIRNATTAGEQIAGWREIGKIIGAYAPEKIEVDVKSADLESLSTAKLMELAAFDNRSFIDGECEDVSEQQLLESLKDEVHQEEER